MSERQHLLVDSSSSSSSSDEDEDRDRNREGFNNQIEYIDVETGEHWCNQEQEGVVELNTCEKKNIYE
eukprot:m.84562 g.84562  ORF g.84562 m.84562 type:complete len:68 (+) comp12161_c0_seq3:1943-2146(+)